MNGITPEAIIEIGPIEITGPVVTTWVVMAGLTASGYLAARRLRLYPAMWQAFLESAVVGVNNAIEEVLERDPWPFFPLIGTMWLLIGVANLVGLIPGLSSPTMDLSTTGALAAVSFMAVHYYGIRFMGLGPYVKHYMEPTWILLPFHVISELSRTIALMLRLFGNMLSGEMVAGILVVVAGFIVPVPFALLETVVAVLQAYIFGMLTLIFIAAGIRSMEHERKKEA